MSAPLTMTIHWASGGETSVQTCIATVDQMMPLVRDGELAILTSEPGEPIWMVAISPGGASGISVRAADPTGAMTVIPHELVEAARTDIAAIRDAFTPDSAAVALFDYLFGTRGE